METMEMDDEMTAGRKPEGLMSMIRWETASLRRMYVVMRHGNAGLKGVAFFAKARHDNGMGVAEQFERDKEQLIHGLLLSTCCQLRNRSGVQ